MDEVNFITNYFDVNHRPDKNIYIIVVFSTSTDYLYKRPRLDFNNIPLDLGQSPTQLLHTGGCFWDYQESSELEQELRKEDPENTYICKVSRCLANIEKFYDISLFLVKFGIDIVDDMEVID
ncbi:hypothetical protein GLOIN_2v1477599 [Rhizophagus irregularis DAOM 181602=DAOM 197198]|uniref:Uncharacterized protein n=1 Tax=Rhizophagus irregularis (strain DAOM 181602 / DAOM 197198 / MUCL 43194) TaxID=747089 RepID=A0A2P4Q4F6_RHIID|nr:hypothetical protein GLOIN_2v1477599 [Rhizophagus irregularis DAOM 181602=DAOM 197198]POG72527.1 hypothetical protein GLOIN_2v1477599 [Rhizophagus irregularis DAOM 181602=DAOM 197198]|eukprot:XP_025179393.1 hypothetical protein GLOIN_2v1477599 [Rhizophagus irregularis DAOM 181602=DAOM 197198]